MKQWYYAASRTSPCTRSGRGTICSSSTRKQFPSDIRKVFGAASNSEGWAHYCEQMVIDAGFHADDPRYRLAQIQDALLRNARFIVGIRMHTKGMTLAAGRGLLRDRGLSAAASRRSESKRGTSDPTYGYYTMGKLMILKLRDDYKAKMGAESAAEVPRHLYRSRSVAAAAHPPGDARGNRTTF